MASYEHPAIAPKITFYTFPDCPWCQRVHILLQELELPFEQVYIELSEPRPQWYLDINPRGLVPAIKYSNGIINDEIIYESSVVAQFLADIRPSHILPASMSTPTAPLVRARIAFFVDTFMGKVANMRQMIMAEDKEASARETVKAIEKDVEPLLLGAAPFFGGSEEMTMAEVLTAPFVLRLYAHSKANAHMSPVLAEEMDKLPNFSKWAKAVMERQSVKENWEEKRVVGRTDKMIEKLRSQAKAKA
ncbi:thioredoxin-like protein [Saccharata proteae CBS 121410]|uniref:Thioredoxin-like protein n=1 Tax=Saccharata proteae CBS 121410 TaxID=1314787 RepID=A0A9P4M3T4_9PEZI|nr:thioredoxin-like protein [Saccharata proteae CBS 121410]